MANVSKEKKLIKKIIPRRLISFARKAVYPEKIHIVEDNLNSLFKTYYRDIAAPDFNQKTAIKNAEFGIYSKCGVDGVIMYILSKIGITNCVFVEMGVEDGRECNTANLSLNFGWRGLIIDANEAGIESAKTYYTEKTAKVKPVHCFVTAENINKLLLDNGFRGEIDLLSIDIDGNDYWVWKAIDAVNPRMVVIEYNPAFGRDKSLTIKYNPEYRYSKPLYFGASLRALVKLGKEKGYILAGCGSWGYDAFFVRRDAVERKFVELLPEEAFYPAPHFIRKFGSAEKQFELIKNLELECI